MSRRKEKRLGDTEQRRSVAFVAEVCQRRQSLPSFFLSSRPCTRPISRPRRVLAALNRRSTMLPFAIPGMAWDPVRKKYFPASAAAPSSVPSTGRPAKRSKPEYDRPVRPASDRTSMHIGARGRQMLGWQQSLGGPSGAGRDRVYVLSVECAASQVLTPLSYVQKPRSDCSDAVAGRQHNISAHACRRELRDDPRSESPAPLTKPPSKLRRELTSFTILTDLWRHRNRRRYCRSCPLAQAGQLG